MSSVGSLIGVSVALGVIALLVWYLGRNKEASKFRKGKIQYTCIAIPVTDPNPLAAKGYCGITATQNNIPSQFNSVEDCQARGCCGQFWACTLASYAGNACTSASLNCVIPPAFAKTKQACESKCNALHPAPIRGTVPSGRYIVKSTLKDSAEFPNGAYLVSYYDPTDHLVYLLFDPSKTIDQADIFTFDNPTGTIRSNKRYEDYYNGQDLYISFSSTDANQAYCILAPLRGSTPPEYSQLATGWFLATDVFSGGRIARSWTQPEPNDWGCVDSGFPYNNAHSVKAAQPFSYCRSVGTCGSMQFIASK